MLLHRSLPYNASRGYCKRPRTLTTAESSSRFPACHCFPCFLVRRATPLRLPLVPQLLAFGQSKFDLHSAVLEVHANGYQGEPLRLGLADQLANLFFMHQQLAGPQRSMVVNISMLVGTY